MNHASIEVRDLRILSLWNHGVRQADIARKVGITRERVRQILERKMPFSKYFSTLYESRVSRRVTRAQVEAKSLERRLRLKSPSLCVVCGTTINYRRRGQGKTQVIRTCSKMCRIQRKLSASESSNMVRNLAVNESNAGSNPASGAKYVKYDALTEARQRAEAQTFVPTGIISIRSKPV